MIMVVRMGMVMGMCMIVRMAMSMIMGMAMICLLVVVRMFMVQIVDFELSRIAATASFAHTILFLIVNQRPMKPP